MAEDKKRDSNFELLRVFSILLVITSHFNIYGSYSNNIGEFNFNWIIKSIFTIGTVANLIFIIITGYFMVKSKPNYKKIIGLVLDMMFYSYIIVGVLYALKIIKPNGNDIIRAIFPMFYGNWFVVKYIILYLFIPILNHIINDISKEKMEKILFVLIILISVIPTFYDFLGFSNHAIFILGYFIGGYISKYWNGEVNKSKVKKCLLLDILLVILSCCGMYILGTLYNISTLTNNSIYFIASNNSIFVIIMATCIFLLFKDMKIKHNKVINNIASSVLGIYLIHENFFIRPLIWTKIFPNNDYFSQWYFFLFGIAKIISVFLVCLIIDKIRIALFGKIREKIVDKVYLIIHRFYIFVYSKYSKLLNN